MTSTSGSGQFARYAADLRHIERRLEAIADGLRDDARESRHRDENRARAEGEIATKIQHLGDELGRIRSRVDKIEGVLKDTGPQEHRPEVEIARIESEKAAAEEKRARASMWTKLVALLSAGGIGAVLKTLFG